MTKPEFTLDDVAMLRTLASPPDVPPFEPLLDLAARLEILARRRRTARRRTARNTREQAALDIDAAIQPLLDIEADCRKLGHYDDDVARDASGVVWQAVRLLQSARAALEQL